MGNHKNLGITLEREDLNIETWCVEPTPLPFYALEGSYLYARMFFGLSLM